MRWFRYVVFFIVMGAVLPLAVRAGGIPSDANVQVTDAGLGGLEDAQTPEIAVQGNTLYATWLDTRDGSSTEMPIYFARSDDGGTSWGTNKRVSLLDYVGFTERPVISVAPDGSIWIAWWLSKCFSINAACGNADRQNDARLALSTDGGQTFSEYLAYDGDNNGDDIDAFAEIHAENDRTFLLTQNPAGGGTDVLLRIISRTNNGLQARTIKLSEGTGNGRITSNVIPDGPHMSLAMRGDTICAAWEDTRDTFAIYGACSIDRGDTFGANFKISGSNDFNPRIAFAPDGTLYATYQDTELGAVSIHRSSNNGASWDSPNQTFGLASGLEIRSYDLDVDAGGQVLVSVAPVDTIGSDKSDLYLATSVDRGQRFALTGPLEDSQGTYPTIATQANSRTVLGNGPNGQRAYVIWGDDRNTQEQIWSTRVDLDSNPPSTPANLSAQGGDTSILLTWDAASDANGVTGYHVERATSAAGPFTRITAQLVTALGYRDIGLDATTYFYRVYAVDNTGNPGAESNVANAAATVGSGLTGLNGTIAYEAGDNLALRSFDGTNLGAERVIGQTAAPAFSQNGRRILSLSSASNKSTLISQALDGSDSQPLFTAELLMDSLDTANDPNVFGAIFQQLHVGTAVCQAFEPRIRSLQPAAQIYNEDYPLATDMAIASDYSLLAYTYRNWCNGVGTGIYDSPRLCIRNIATKQETCLDGRNAQDSDFVPNRATLVFSADFTGQPELWRADVQANGTLTNMTQLTRGPAGQPSLAPRVSTDGNWVIFERDIDSSPGENRVLHAVRLDGDGLRSLGVSGTTPAWAGGGPAPVIIAGANRVMLPFVVR